MDILLSWGALSALFILASGIPYAIAIYRRKVPRPVISGWLLWSIIGVLLLVTHRNAGARADTTLLPAILGCTNPILILFLSLRYGEWRWGRLDTVCVVVCIITIVAWRMVKSPVIALASGLLADAVAAIPQIKKSFVDPEGEPWFPWTVFAIGSGINFFGVEKWDLEHTLYPFWMTFGSLVIALPIVIHRLRRPPPSLVR